MKVNREDTAITRKRYDRIAPIYDLTETVAERLLFRRWRRKVWRELAGAREILEIGVGTGKNILYYPKDSRITAIDLSEKMLSKARKRARSLDIGNVELMLMDAQAMDFRDDSFDAVVATFVFCSVPAPVRGLDETRRVLRPSGKAVFLEHMRPENKVLGKIFDLLNPVVVRMTGANINRRTMANLRRSGLVTRNVVDLTPYSIVRLIIAGTTDETR